MQKINSVAIFLGLALMGYFISQGMENFNRRERIISVRGLAEKEVKSNLVVWKINYNVSSEKMDQVRSELPRVQKSIQDYLLASGFTALEISKNSSIKDRQAMDYGAEKGNRFVASGAFTVTSHKVEIAQKAQEKVDELLKMGIVITGDKLEFYFTDLNQIKPEMLDQASVNAKEAAQGFAKSMSVGVGKLKSATQGIFSIENTIGGADAEYQAASSLGKKVRVVTQVEFYID